MYGLSNFLSVLWYTVAGWFGLGRHQVQAVTLFDGTDVHAPIDPNNGAGYYMNWVEAANQGHLIQVGGDGEGGAGFYM